MWHTYWQYRMLLQISWRFSDIIVRIFFHNLFNLFLDRSPTWPVWLWLCLLRDDVCFHRRYYWFIFTYNYSRKANIRPHAVANLSSKESRKDKGLYTLLRDKSHTTQKHKNSSSNLHFIHLMLILLPLCPCVLGTSSRANS